MSFNDTDVLSHLRENLCQGYEDRDSDAGNEAPRQERLLESIKALLREMNMKTSRKMDSKMSRIHIHINRRAIRPVLNDSVITEL